MNIFFKKIKEIFLTENTVVNKFKKHHTHKAERM